MNVVEVAHSWAAVTTRDPDGTKPGEVACLSSKRKSVVLIGRGGPAREPNP
jgi:hypothetical protein